MSRTKISFIFFLLNTIHLCLSSIISSDFKIQSESLYMHFKSGNNNETHFLSIDLNSNQTYILDYLYMGSSPYKRILKTNDQIYIGGNSYLGTEYQDKMNFGNNFKNQIKSFNFYVVDPGPNKDKTIKPSVLSLGLNINNKKHSVVHTLKSEGVIASSKFGLKFYPSFDLEKNGTIYFGGVPKEEIERLPYNKKIHVTKEKNINGWSSFTTKVIINEKKVETINYLTEFSTVSKKIEVPNELFYFIVDNYLNDFIPDKLCDIDLTKTIQCSEHAMKLLVNTTIDFIIDKSSFILTVQDLFEKTIDNKYLFLITKNEKINKNHIIVGYVFLQKYISLFDYDSQTISFFSNQNFSNSNNKQNILKIIFYITSALLCCFLINCYIKYRSKKEKRRRLIKYDYYYSI